MKEGKKKEVDRHLLTDIVMPVLSEYADAKFQLVGKQDQLAEDFRRLRADAEFRSYRDQRISRDSLQKASAMYRAHLEGIVGVVSVQASSFPNKADLRVSL